MSRNRPKPQASQWRINTEITAKEVRVIGEDGEQVDVMSVSDALKKAQDAGLDLVEIAPQAKPPVVKIIEFGKFKYQQEKKEREQKRKTKQTDVKEVRFSPFIAEGDYNTRLNRAIDFMREGHKIKAVVKFKGRQMTSKTFGYDVMQRILEDIGEGVNIDMEPKFLGRHLTMVISPTNKYKPPKNDKDKTKNTKISQQAI